MTSVALHLFIYYHKQARATKRHYFKALSYLFFPFIFYGIIYSISGASSFGGWREAWNPIIPYNTLIAVIISIVVMINFINATYRQ